jgi:hypothetical protein
LPGDAHPCEAEVVTRMTAARFRSIGDVRSGSVERVASAAGFLHQCPRET